MKNAIFAALILFGARAEAKSASISGTFAIDTAVKFQAPYQDTLVFAGGKMTSAVLGKNGFLKAKVVADEDGDAIKFDLTMKHPKKDQGTTTWKGLVRGESITGTIVWYKPGLEPIHYEFSGKRTK